MEHQFEWENPPRGLGWTILLLALTFLLALLLYLGIQGRL
jgi:hypothetical protein